MYISRSHTIIHIINNCKGQYITNRNKNSYILIYCLLILDKHKRKTKLPGVEPVTSGLLDFGFPTSPYFIIIIVIFIIIIIINIK